MEVAVDSVWASPTFLHMRVLVWVGPDRWLKKFYAAVPLEDLVVEALDRRFLEALVLSGEPDPVDGLQDPLPGI